MNNRHMHNLVRPKLTPTSMQALNPNLISIQTPGMLNPARTAVNIANPLNSSLVLKKGKERENPKKKKPSTLKKVSYFI